MCGNMKFISSVDQIIAPKIALTLNTIIWNLPETILHVSLSFLSVAESSLYHKHYCM